MDVLTQINAARAALHELETEILKDYVSRCVARAFSNGEAAKQRRKIEDLAETIGRMTR